MRFDRFITLSMVQPVRRAFQALGSRPSALDDALPILMYHSISDEAELDRAAYYRTNTNPAVFAQHLELLSALGYRAVTLTEGLAAIEGGGSKEQKRVVLTFDDGFRDFYTHAFPLLQKHNFSATMYLPTAFISAKRASFKKKECLTWNEIRELQGAGIEFGSHTMNHPKLVELNWPDIETELTDSKTEIEQQLQTAVAGFAYPYAFPQADENFAKQFHHLLDEAGYESCVTTEIGRAEKGDDPLQLCRLPANSDDDSRLLEAKLKGDYDWLAFPQMVAKRLKKSGLRPDRPLALPCLTSRG